MRRQIKTLGADCPGFLSSSSPVASTTCCFSLLAEAEKLEVATAAAGVQRNYKSTELASSTSMVESFLKVTNYEEVSASIEWIDPRKERRATWSVLTPVSYLRESTRAPLLDGGDGP